MSEPAKKSNRGGKRPGAGRKPKGYVSPSALVGLDLAAAAGTPAPKQIESLARLHARAALETLKTVMLHSASDAAKVNAANAILDRGFGKTSTESGIDQMLPLFDQVFLATTSGEMMEEARKLAPLAVAALVKIAQGSASDAARVAAAKALLDRGLGVASPARLDAYRDASKVIGKKEEAARVALAAGVGTEWGDDLTPPAMN